jgi:hypothetical protein
MRFPSAQRKNTDTHKYHPTGLEHGCGTSTILYQNCEAEATKTEQATYHLTELNRASAASSYFRSRYNKRFILHSKLIIKDDPSIQRSRLRR